MTTERINFDKNQLLSSLSLALDLAENKTIEHARRTAYVALAIAREMGLAEEVVKDVYSAAFLHDIGVTEARQDYHQDLEYLVMHPKIGHRIVSKLPFSANVASYVMHHHANWDGSGPFEMDADSIPLGAQIIYLADQLDIKYNRQLPYFQQREELTEWAVTNSKKLFNPDIVESFLSLSGREKFWLDYTFHNIGTILDGIKPEQEITLGIDDLHGITQAFAIIIDNKSKFTLHHSQGVTQTVTRTAKELGFDPVMITKLEIAAGLHDLGKLAVPNAILDKPGALSKEEFQVIKSHTYYTKTILGMINGFEEIKEWAGNHHETLDGQGYPEKKPGSDLTTPERLMTVCDIYQALTEERPYRKPMTSAEALVIMDRLFSDGKVCGYSLEALKNVV